MLSPGRQRAACPVGFFERIKVCLCLAAPAGMLPEVPAAPSPRSAAHSNTQLAPRLPAHLPGTVAPLVCSVTPFCVCCSNPFSAHEVHIDDEQLDFFRAQLAQASAAGRPVVVFTHAPVLGSGLKVVQTVHVKNRWVQTWAAASAWRLSSVAAALWHLACPYYRVSTAVQLASVPYLCCCAALRRHQSTTCRRCAWLNHSSRPQEFIELVQQHPNIRLWFRCAAGTHWSGTHSSGVLLLLCLCASCA
jgi:hypothetical protein